jgi:hypothetical protein
MSDVRGISFNERDSKIVEVLVALLIEHFGYAHMYINKRQQAIKFALRKPSQAQLHHPRGYLLFLEIISKPNGAFVRRPRVPKHGNKIQELTAQNVKSVFEDAKVWFREVTQKRVPVGIQGTGDSRVLAGGQFESKRSKH